MWHNKRKLLILVCSGAVVILLLFLFKPLSQEPSTATVAETESVSVPLTENQTENGTGTVTATDTAAENPTNQDPTLLFPTPKLNAVEEKKWQTFKQILTSKNDNDPRIDKELRNLSPAFKDELYKGYETLALEKRSERGFIVFLTAREFSSAEDLQFIKKVYEEPACYSFDKCDTPGEVDPHTAGIDDVSLSYPQLAGLYSIDQRLKSNPDLLKNESVKNELRSVLREASEFPNAAVQKRAQDLRKRYDL